MLGDRVNNDDDECEMVKQKFHEIDKKNAKVHILTYFQ